IAFGEMVDLLCERGAVEGALKLERLWNDLQKSHTFSLLCAYNLRNFREARTMQDFAHVCDAHSAVIPSETFLGKPAEADSSQLAAHFQQRALALEFEIARRQTMERELQAVIERDRFLAAVVESSDDAIITKSLDGIITS